VLVNEGAPERRILVNPAMAIGLKPVAMAVGYARPLLCIMSSDHLPTAGGRPPEADRRW
jgi:hypothetical protein